MAKANNQADETVRRELTAVRDKLLALHKALIDSERVEYESSFGTIPTPHHFLKLLIDDPWFAWLRPFSAMMAAIDERMDDEEPLTLGDYQRVKREAITLLRASEEGDGFERSYFESLQREPEVVLAHAEVMKLLKG